MAQKPVRQGSQYNRYVGGSLAYDYDYLERERRRHAERTEREYAERRAREQAIHREPRRKKAVARRRRERIRVSPVAVLGFAVASVMLVALLMNYAELASISNEVVSMQKKLSVLEEEHVALVARYERTFDLTAIKAAAESTGMAKPSASQIYYVDLSEPDNVVLYQRAETNMLGKALTSVGRNVEALVEYFK